MKALLCSLAPLIVMSALPVQAQAPDHSMHGRQEQKTAPTTDPHAGHAMPAIDAKPATPAAPGSASPPAPDPHAEHQMPAAPPLGGVQAGDTPMQAEQAGDPHAGHDDMATEPPNVMTSADDPGRPPEQPAPAAANTTPAHAADLHFDPAAMSASRRQLVLENGAMRTSFVLIDQLEASFDDDTEGYAWDAQGWYGGDINKFWWKTEGEGVFDDDVEGAELQALYSRAITPLFDAQVGLRQVYTPDADRTDLVVGLQGLAPYWFEIDTAAFISNEGEVRARIEAEYDLRLTQRLILQPRAELNLSADDIPELDIGAGLTSAELGARLRYEIRREFAPYAGVEWTGATGDTRSLLRSRGEDSDETRFVVGIRAWF